MSTRAWPISYRNFPQRTLAMLKGQTITTEYGHELHARDWPEIKQELFLRNMILFTPPLAAQPWLDEAIADPKATVYCDAESHPVSLSVRQGRFVRRLATLSSWTEAAEPLPAIRDLLDRGGVGDHPTPSAFGQAMMVRHWPDAARRLARPALPFWTIMHDSLIGGRAEVFRPRELFAALYEVDRNSGYPASAMSVPSGTAYGATEFTGVTGYYRCHWTATGNALLPLGVRLPGNRLAWPTTGTYTGWYWQEEIQAARERGAHVEIVTGFAWPRVESVLGDWAKQMYRLRWECAMPELAKKASVAAIGRFLCERKDRYLVPAPANGDTIAIDEHLGPTGYWMHEETKERADALIHVGSYILMQCRMALLRRMEQERRQALVATNFDAVYTTEQPKSTSLEIGDWKWNKLTNAIIPHLRSLESDQKSQNPGHITA